MSYRIHTIGTLIQTDPKEAAKEIRKIIRRNKGNVSACSEEAGTDRRTFQRWIEALDEVFSIKNYIHKTREKAGPKRIRNAGRPRANS